MQITKSSKNQVILTVSQINGYISQTLEKHFASVWIKGEISNLTKHSSGHWYFSLKEESAQIKSVMFRGYNQKLSFVPENGMEVLVEGQVNVYAPRGTYQILCKHMESLGSGALQKNFEKLKEKLKNEGLFDSKTKKPIPPHPKHVGVISSPTGAAIRDILQILKRRSSGLKVTLIPAIVQGDAAPASLMLALSQAQKIKTIDTLIISRGGGSMEDLFGFNDEALARAIFDCPIPIISAVGHEIDFTISDFVADLRAPTPSAAAELVVQSSKELSQQIRKIKKQLIQNIVLQIKFFKERVKSLQNQLVSPQKLLQDKAQRIDELSLSLSHSMKHILEKEKSSLNNLNLALSRSIKYILEKEKSGLNNLKQLLESLDPRQVMQRGFCIVSTQNGATINNVQQLKIKENISLEFFKGKAKATVTEKEKV